MHLFQAPLVKLRRDGNMLQMPTETLSKMSIPMRIVARNVTKGAPTSSHIGQITRLAIARNPRKTDRGTDLTPSLEWPRAVETPKPFLRNTTAGRHTQNLKNKFDQ